MLSWARSGKDTKDGVDGLSWMRNSSSVWSCRARRAMLMGERGGGVAGVLARVVALWRGRSSESVMCFGDEENR